MPTYQYEVIKGGVPHREGGIDSETNVLDQETVPDPEFADKSRRWLTALQFVVEYMEENELEKIELIKQ